MPLENLLHSPDSGFDRRPSEHGRFYERIGLLPTVPRAKNGYRVFDDRHLAQLRLLRAAFRAEILSDTLRREAYEIVKTAAVGDVGEAYRRAEQYREHLREERAKAEEAILIAQNILGDIGTDRRNPRVQRQT